MNSLAHSSGQGAASIPGGTEAPVRVKLSRTKGWRMPPNTVVVSRPSRWGNPHNWQDWREAWPPHVPVRGGDYDEMGRDDWCRGQAYEAFAEDLRDGTIVLPLEELRGKNLACWCPLGGGLRKPCHADLLLELANAPAATEGESPSVGTKAEGRSHPNQPGETSRG